MKSVIFDFDGTLADTLPICFYAFQQVFQAFDGRTLTHDEIKQMFGPSETGIINTNLNHPNKAAAIELYYDVYKNYHHDFIIANDDVLKLLLLLKERGIKLGIFTGKARRSLYLSLQALQLEGIFDAIITGDDVKNPKPHEEGLLRVVNLLNLSPSDVWCVGDSDADILAGKQANIYTLGVMWLPNYKPNPFNIQPDAKIHRFSVFHVLLQGGAL